MIRMSSPKDQDLRNKSRGLFGVRREAGDTRERQQSREHMGINLVQVRFVVQTMSKEGWTTAKTTRRTAETTTATRGGNGGGEGPEKSKAGSGEPRKFIPIRPFRPTTSPICFLLNRSNSSSVARSPALRQQILTTNINHLAGQEADVQTVVVVNWLVNQ
jgi:hypothetical protein